MWRYVAILNHGRPLLNDDGTGCRAAGRWSCRERVDDRCAQAVERLTSASAAVTVAASSPVAQRHVRRRTCVTWTLRKRLMLTARWKRLQVDLKKVLICSYVG